MSRIDEPADYLSQRIQQTAMNKKYVDDGAPSILLPYLTKHSIVMADDIAAGLVADGFEANRVLFAGQGAKALKDRDNDFEPVWMRLLKWVQFLKPLEKDNIKELINWVVPVDNNGKINYPTTFAGRVTIVKGFIAKSLSYADGTSPLQPFITVNGDDLPALLIDVNAAVVFDANGVALNRKAEVQTQKRNNAWAAPLANMVGIGTYLIGLYVADTKTVGLWGFTVVDTPTEPTVRTVTLLPLKEKIITGIILGSELENTGAYPFGYYRGKKKKGEPTMVAAGEKVGMNKGCSSIVAEHFGTVGTVTFTVLTA